MCTIADFKVTSGSVTGAVHLYTDGQLRGRNNQDALRIVLDENYLVAVTADGCSKVPFSELGALATAEILSKIILQIAQSGGFASDDSSQVQSTCKSIHRQSLYALNSILHELGHMANLPRRDAAALLDRYFFCAIMVAVVTPTFTCILNFGDGVFAINGQITEIGPFADDRPPYLAYDLEARCRLPNRTMQQFQVQCVMPTAKVQSLAIGSDGLTHLMKCANRRIPGQRRKVGPLSQLWEDERFFGPQIPDGHWEISPITNWLRKLNTQAINPRGNRRFQPLLPDDTTVVVIKRK